MSSLTEHRPTDTENAARHDHQASTAELVKQASDQATRLVRDEMRLLRAEMTDKAKQMSVGAGMLSAAGLLALYGLGAAVATVMIALSIVWPAWLAALVVTVAIFIVAGIAALIGRSRLKKATPPKPEETTASVRADIGEIRDRAQS
ncbi:MAG: phage holin family protein [Stackebrandtia sp.]